MESIPNVLMNSSVVTALSDPDLAAIELFKGYPDGLLEFATACCVIFMLIGIPGNVITIIALIRYEKVRNATAIFIINLSCSDLLFCCFNLPLAGLTFYKRSWAHGQLLCRLFPLARYALVAVSLFTVLAITVNRYVMIAHPKLYPKLYKNRNIAIMLITIWAVSFGVVTPTWFEKWGVFGLDTSIGSCSILCDERGRSPKKSLFLTAFILPCVAIILCYARIFFIVRKATMKSLNHVKKVSSTPEESLSSTASARVTTDNTSSYNIEQIKNAHVSYSCNGASSLPRVATFSADTKEEIVRHPDDIHNEPVRLRRSNLRKSMALLRITLPSRKDRRLGTMIIAIMISFCICHLPITITKVLRELNPYPASNIASYILLYLSSSINPVIYVLMSSEYRKAYKNLFRRRNKVNKMSVRNNR
ncbi:G-protein coupled receptor moody-like [Pararge aegeria]|uniref:Jg6551 protein n=1 Tax=Pararge aegeria aegeria TaxID=348720 RepID=A0A8S4S1K1_9NEOP|nr:G-protein coupled receptor moody-like [Pararge aegeria]CAH2245643.1 jg6551 [Pararge aegeria aegeria]